MPLATALNDYYKIKQANKPVIKRSHVISMKDFVLDPSYSFAGWFRNIRSTQMFLVN